MQGNPQLAVFVELLWLRNFMTLVSGVCNSHDTFQKVHESSRITQELVCPRKDQMKVPSETLPFFDKEIGKIFEFIFQV